MDTSMVTHDGSRVQVSTGQGRVRKFYPMMFPYPFGQVTGLWRVRSGVKCQCSQHSHLTDSTEPSTKSHPIGVLNNLCPPPLSSQTASCVDDNHHHLNHNGTCQHQQQQQHLACRQPPWRSQPPHHTPHVNDHTTTCQITCQWWPNHNGHRY